MTKKIYNYDNNGYYTLTNEANIDPLESKKRNKNIYLLPKNATFAKVLPSKKDKLIKWNKNNSEWFYEDILENQKKNEVNETEEEKTKRLRSNALSVRLSYLQSTDWYVLREYDQPDSYPTEVKKRRILARNQINEIEKILTLEEANSIAVNYPFKVKIN